MPQSKSKPKTGREVPTSFRLPRELIEALDWACEVNLRSRSQQAELYLREALLEDGYLRPEPDERR